MTAPASPRHAFVVVTVRSIASMRPSALAPIRPSDSEIAVPISVTVITAAAWVASRAKIHVIGPKPSTVEASSRNTITARQVVSVNWAMLKTILMTGSRRSKSSTTTGPTRPARTRSIGEAKGRPKTSGRSPSEKECALRRKCRCTTQRSAARKPRARPHHGMWTPMSNGGSSCTGPASSAAEASTIPTFNAQTPPAADSRRNAPFLGDMGPHRRQEPQPEALDGCPMKLERGAEQEVPGEADQAVEEPPQLLDRHAAHDPRPIPCLVARLADARQGDEGTRRPESRCDIGDQRVGERHL